MGTGQVTSLSRVFSPGNNHSDDDGTYSVRDFVGIDFTGNNTHKQLA